MKVLYLFTLALLLGSSEAIQIKTKEDSAPVKSVKTSKSNKLEKENKPPVEGALLNVDMKLKSNAAMMIDIQSKIKMVEAIMIKKESPNCDEKCAA